jgi:hypothetical protein
LISGKPAIPMPIGKKFARRIVPKPRRIPLPVPMVQISNGLVQGAAVDRDGQVWTWGGGKSPDIEAPGDDIRDASGFVAHRVTGLPPVKLIAADSTTYVVTQAGDVWRWGQSRATRAPVVSAVPSRVGGLSNIVGLSNTSFYVAFLDQGGIVSFLGGAPDDALDRAVDEPHTTIQLPPAKFVSAGARITTDGVVLYFSDLREGIVQRLELGD